MATHEVGAEVHLHAWQLRYPSRIVLNCRRIIGLSAKSTSLAGSACTLKTGQAKRFSMGGCRPNRSDQRAD
jgi:hypothetical protein